MVLSPPWHSFILTNQINNSSMAKRKVLSTMIRGQQNCLSTIFCLMSNSMAISWTSHLAFSGVNGLTLTQARCFYQPYLGYACSLGFQWSKCVSCCSHSVCADNRRRLVFIHFSHSCTTASCCLSCHVVIPGMYFMSFVWSARAMGRLLPLNSLSQPQQ